ncbi:MAG: hypothetical protein ACOVRB_12210 [Akkermansiaceae bacterium]
MSHSEDQSGMRSMRASAWIFPWRRSFRRRWSLLVAFVLVSPVLALLLSTIRVRVFFTPPALNRSAELVMIPDLPENRAWLERIAQQTPFPAIGPSRPVEVLSDAALRAELRPVFQSGQQLRDVELPKSKPAFEQNWWWPPLEPTESLAVKSPPTSNLTLQPRLRWLAALKPDQLPTEWPTYAGPVGMASGTKYMMEVDSEGRVITCIAATKDSDSRLVALENWLRRLRFPASKQALGWLACEIIWEHAHD